MATAGLQVWNDGGLYQIDGTIPNVQLRSKQTGVAAFESVYIGSNPGGSYNGVLPIIDFYVQSSSPVFALYSPGNPAVIKKTETDNAGNWHLQVLCAYVGQSVTLLTFDAALPAQSGAGFQVFNASGVCVFDAGAPALVVTGAYSGNTANVSPTAYIYNGTVTYTPNVVFPMPGGRKFAVVGAMGPLLNNYSGTVGNGQANTYLSPGMFQCDDGQIQMPICVFGMTPAPVQAQINYSTAPLTISHQLTAYGSCFNYQFLAADVTGII